MSRKLSCLLDANVVIECYKLGVWEALIERTEAVVPDAVAEDEALFFPKGEARIPIDLPDLAARGRIRRVGASLLQLDAMFSRFTESLRQDIHAGEAEALAYLLSGTEPDLAFCSGDCTALHRLALLDLRDSAVSLEELLDKCGLSKPLRPEYTRECMRKQLDIGSEVSASHRKTGDALGHRPEALLL